MAIVDKDFVVANYLFDVDMIDSDGNAFTDAAYQHAIDAAQQLVSRETNLPISSGTNLYRVFKDRHDADPGGGLVFSLTERPIRKITGALVRYGNQSLFSVPVDTDDGWVDLLDPMTGVVQIVPFAGSVTFQGLPAQSLLMAYTPNSRGKWEFTYKAGFMVYSKAAALTSVADTFVPAESTFWSQITLTLNVAAGGAGISFLVTGTDEFGEAQTETLVFSSSATTKTTDASFREVTSIARSAGAWGSAASATVSASSVPEDIKQLVGLVAANTLLITAGDLILGPGIQSQSLSMDGLSQSISSSASAMYSGYASRVKDNNALIAQIQKNIRAHYHGIAVYAL